MVTVSELNSPNMPQWCPGCGDFGILIALKGALAKVGAEPHETVVVSGVGCGSKLPHYVRTYGFEGLHGRSLPPATGIHLANDRLTVVAVGGDGDGVRNRHGALCARHEEEPELYLYSAGQ